LTRTDVTFLLASGGHNTGIINEPGHPHRHYRISLKKKGDKYIDSDKWFETTSVKKGSWWLEWEQWLVNEKTEKVSPPEMGGRRSCGRMLD